MGYSIGRHSRHLNLEFELKCVVGLSGYFAGTFSGFYICLDPPFVVDSSSVVILDSFLFMPALASAERQLLLTECAIHSLDSARTQDIPLRSLGIILTITCTTLRPGGKAARIIELTHMAANYGSYLSNKSTCF